MNIKITIWQDCMERIDWLEEICRTNDHSTLRFCCRLTSLHYSLLCEPFYKKKKKAWCSELEQIKYASSYPSPNTPSSLPSWCRHSISNSSLSYESVSCDFLKSREIALCYFEWQDCTFVEPHISLSCTSCLLIYVLQLLEQIIINCVA